MKIIHLKDIGVNYLEKLKALTKETGKAAPDGLYHFTNPQTGQRFLTRLYACPQCGGTAWGPRDDDPGVWQCLGCVQAAATADPVPPQSCAMPVEGDEPWPNSV